jgi:diguanylate cyclase (GGDEF)-like protein
VDKDEYDASDLSVYVNAKITDTDGSVMGVCGVGVRMTGIQSLFRMLEEDFNVKISLVNPYGIVQVDTDVSSIERTSLAHLLGEDGETGYVYHDLGRGRFAVSKYIESMDWYLIVQSGDTGEASRFLNIILLNAGLCALVLVILFAALRRNRRHTEALAAASLLDNLTQLSNRRAFDEDRLALGSEASRANLVCVAIDVNGLKTANDTLGHDAGDELICGAATCMRDVFGPYGTTYRTGGDEFAALLHLDEGQLDEVRQAFDAAVAAWSGNEVKSLSVSCGYAPQREFPDQDVYGLCRIADERMYEDKSQYYARTGIDRRRT